MKIFVSGEMMMIIGGTTKRYGLGKRKVSIKYKYQTILFPFFLMYLILILILNLISTSILFAEDKADSYTFDKDGVCQRVSREDIPVAPVPKVSVDSTFCKKEQAMAYKWISAENGLSSECYMVEANTPSKKISRVTNDFCRKEGLSLKPTQLQSYVLKGSSCYEVVAPSTSEEKTIGKTTDNLCRAVGTKGRLFALLPNGQCSEFTVPPTTQVIAQTPIVKPKTGFLSFFQRLFSSGGTETIIPPPLIKDTPQDPSTLKEQDLLNIIDNVDCFVKTVPLSNCLNLTSETAFTYMWRADGTCGQYTKGGREGNHYISPLVQVFAPVDDKYCLEDREKGESQKFSYQWDDTSGSGKCAEYVSSIAPKQWNGKTWVKEWKILIQKYTSDIQSRPSDVKRSILKRYVDPFYCRKNSAPPIYELDGKKCYEKTPGNEVKIREVTPSKCLEVSGNCDLKGRVARGIGGSRIFELANDVLKIVDARNVVNFAKARRVYDVIEGVVNKFGGIDKLKHWNDQGLASDKRDYLEEQKNILTAIITGLSDPQYLEQQKPYQERLAKLEKNLRDLAPELEAEEQRRITQNMLAEASRIEEKRRADAAALESRARKVEQQIQTENDSNRDNLKEAMHMERINDISGITNERRKKLKRMLSNKLLLTYFNAREKNSDIGIARRAVISELWNNMRCFRSDTPNVNDFKKAVKRLQENIDLYEKHYPDRQLLQVALKSLEAEKSSIDSSDLSALETLKQKRQQELANDSKNTTLAQDNLQQGLNYSGTLSQENNNKNQASIEELRKKFLKALNLRTLSTDKEKNLITNDLILNYFKSKTEIEKQYTGVQLQENLHQLNKDTAKAIITTTMSYNDQIDNASTLESIAAPAVESFFNLIKQYQSTYLWGGLETALTPLRKQQLDDYKTDQLLQAKRDQIAKKKTLQESWNLKEDILVAMYPRMTRYENRSKGIKSINTIILDYWKSIDSDANKEVALRKMKSSVEKEMERNRTEEDPLSIGEVRDAVKLFTDYVTYNHYRRAYPTHMSTQDEERFLTDDDPIRSKIGTISRVAIITGKVIAKIAEVGSKLIP